MRPSFIQLGEEYFATVIAGPMEDVLRALGPFDSATRAVAAAAKHLKPKPPAAPPRKASEPAAVEAWRDDRARQMLQEREIVDLAGIEVVRKRRRIIRTI